MLRVSPWLLCVSVVGKNRKFLNRIAAARDKYLRLTQGKADNAVASRELPADNPKGVLISWACHHGLSIMLPSAVVSLQKFQHIEFTRLNADTKWPFTLTTGDGASPDEAVLRVTEEPVNDLGKYYKAYQLNKTGLRVRAKETTFIGGKSMDDAVSVRFALAAPLPFPTWSSRLRTYADQEGDLVKNAYASVNTLTFHRQWSSRLRVPVVQLEWTPREPEDVKMFIKVTKGCGDLQLTGLSPMRQLYLSFVSQAHTNALNLLKIRVTGSSSSVGKEAVEVDSDGGRWVSATAETLEAAVATKQPITLLAACAYRQSGWVPKTVVSNVRAALIAQRKEQKAAREKVRREKIAARAAKRKARHAQLMLRRAEKRKVRSEKRKERRAARAAKRAEKWAAKQKMRSEKRKKRLARQALKRAEKWKLQAAKQAARRARIAEKRKAALVARKERLALARLRRVERKKTKAAETALRAQMRKEERAAAKTALVQKLKKKVAASSAANAARKAVLGRKEAAAKSKPKKSAGNVATPATKKVKVIAAASAPSAAAPAVHPPAGTVPTPTVAGTSVDL